MRCDVILFVCAANGTQHTRYLYIVFVESLRWFAVSRSGGILSFVLFDSINSFLTKITSFKMKIIIISPLTGNCMQRIDDWTIKILKIKLIFLLRSSRRTIYFHVYFHFSHSFRSISSSGLCLGEWRKTAHTCLNFMVFARSFASLFHVHCACSRIWANASPHRYVCAVQYMLLMRSKNTLKNMV